MGLMLGRKHLAALSLLVLLRQETRLGTSEMKKLGRSRIAWVVLELKSQLGCGSLSLDAELLFLSTFRQGEIWSLLYFTVGQYSCFS